MNPNQIFEDFDRKYQGSFVQVSFKGEEPGLFQLVRTTNGTKFPKLELTSDKVGTIVLNYNTNARIFFKMPQSTYIQLGAEAFFFTRRPERQWKRGIHRNNCGVFGPLNQYTGRRDSHFVDFNSIRAAFSPQYTSFKEALNLLASKKCKSVALSRNLALINPGKVGYILFYRFAPIGTVTPDGIINCPDFKEVLTHEIK